MELKTMHRVMEFKQRSRLVRHSVYDKSHPTYNDKNKTVLVEFKDETNGNPVKEFIGPRATMYSILKKDDVNRRQRRQQRE